MAVVAAIAAVAVVSAIAQYYQAEKARGASEKELKKIQAMWDGIVPPNFNASIMDPPDYIRELPPPPDFDMRKLTPEAYKVVAKYEPQAAPLIKEAAPQVVKDSGEGKEGRQAQMEALRELQRIAAADRDPAMMAMLDEAAKRGQVESQSRQQSILQDAQRRGMLGSGMSLAAQLSGAEQAQSDQAALGRQAALEGYRNKLQALRDSASLGGNIMAADRSLSGQNADIINAFNERTSRNAQNQANLAAQIANSGMLYNTQAAQGAADKTTGTNNEFMQFNAGRNDDLLAKLYGIQMDQTQYKNALAADKANWEKGERDRQDQQKQQTYQNQVQLAGGKAGIGQMFAQNAIGAGQDKNAAIQGATQGAIAALQYGANKKDEEDDEGHSGSWN